MTYCSFSLAALNFPPSAHYQDGKFRNAINMREYGFGEMASLWRNAMVNKPAGTVPGKPIPVRPLTRAVLLAAPDNNVCRLGHSTMLGNWVAPST